MLIIAKKKGKETILTHVTRAFLPALHSSPIPGCSQRRPERSRVLTLVIPAEFQAGPLPTKQSQSWKGSSRSQVLAAHLFKLTLVSFRSVLQFSLNGFCTFSVKFNSKFYFPWCYCNCGFLYHMSSNCLLFVHMKSYYVLISYPNTSLNSFVCYFYHEQSLHISRY